MKLIAWLACPLSAIPFLALALPMPAGQPAQAAVGAPFDPTSYVNPFIGTADAIVPATDPVPAGARGGTFPGATTPFGMVQWTPMTPSVLPDGSGKRDVPIGYVYRDQTIIGFPLTQMSGAGCSGNEGELPVMPTFDPAAAARIGDLDGTSLAALPANYSHDQESAQPGYYRVKLNDGIQVELTATTRTGFARLDYPAASAAPALVIDTSRSNTLTHAKGELHRVGRNELAGYTVGGNFCGAGTYRLYFHAQLDQPFELSQHDGVATLRFHGGRAATVLLKMGLSYVSAANAQANLSVENPDWDFERVRLAAHEAWRSRLATVEIQGADRGNLRMFYSALYHALLSPNVNSDANGDFIGFDQQTHRVAPGHTHYANYSNWDIYRSLSPLLGMLFPKQTSDMMQSLVDDATQCGGIPRWSPINTDAGIMPGDSGVATVVDAYMFGATHFDAKQALGFMKKVGDDPSVTCNGSSMRDSEQRMRDYLSLGYVPLDDGWWAGSVGLEFAGVDFAISRLAEVLGDVDTASRYRLRSDNWRRQFNPEQRQLLPRYRNGSWQLHPKANEDMVEGNAEQYTWMLSHDNRGLFDLVGGDVAVIKRLDSFFTDLNAGIEKPNFYIGNEPSFATPWLYNWAGAPWRTQKVVRDVLERVFADAPGGLPGNDDLGAVSSWYVWASIGLYPAIPAVGGLTLGSPRFDRVVLHWADGSRTLRINAPGASPRRAYIQRVSLDGRPLDHAWLDLDPQLRGDSELRIELGEQPSAWGVGGASAMPSFGPKLDSDGMTRSPAKPDGAE